MSVHSVTVAYSGIISEHLYADCDAIDKWRTSPYGTPTIGQRLPYLVSVDGPDVCGRCRRRWELDRGR